LEVVLWFLSALALVVVLTLVGLATASLIHRQGMSPGEDLVVALGGAIGIPAIAAAVQLVEPIPYWYASPVLMVALLLASAVILWRRRAWLLTLVRDAQVLFLSASLAALFVLGITIAALPWDRPSDGGAGTVGSFHAPNMPGDTLLQYRTAEILQNRMDIQATDYYVNYWFISDRTPLLGLTTVFVESASGIQLPTSLDALGAPFQVIDPYGYWLYRLICIFANAMAVVSAGLVAWELFGARVARIGSVFVVLSPFILINIVFHWPKLLAGFFIVAFYFWTLVRRRPVLAGVGAAGAVLSHPVGALFLPGVFVLLLVRQRWRQFMETGAAAAIVVSPWFFWTSVIFHHTSRMLTYPIGFALVDPTNPWPEIKSGMVSYLRRPILGLLDDRWITIRNTLTAWPFPRSVLGARSLRALAVAVYEVFRTSFPGMFGAGLALFGYATWKRVLTIDFWLATLGASTLCVFLFWGFDPRAVAQEAFQPGSALWIMLAAAILSAFSATLIRLAIVVTAVEWIGFCYVLLLKAPGLAAWRFSDAMLVFISLAVVGVVSLAGWRAAAMPSAKPLEPLPQLVPEVAPELADIPVAP
jgi:hypothetical protein